MKMKVKSDLSGPFLLLLLFLLNTTVPGLGTVVTKRYTYIDEHHHTWQDAQRYCSELHDDLATIYTQSDEDLIPSMQVYYAWIGLQRNTNSSTPNNWSWSTGALGYNNWAQGQPNPDDTCATIHWTSRRFYGNTCGGYFFFLCQRPNPPYFKFMPLSMTRSEAQEFCRREDYYLAVIKSNIYLQNLNDQDFPVWIGLHSDDGILKWSSGSSAFRNWAPDEPGIEGNCVSISSRDKRMATQDCSARFPFVCLEDNVVLVKERKTWEEALEHCRAHESEMLSVQPGEDHNYVMSKVMKADTEGVWTGLRFLAGDWMWMDGASVSYTDLPLCPPLGQFCGALSKNNEGSMEPTDCTERKNFLCYI